CAKTTNFDYW
nr:immunoglobulin heavy chain junction region [Mus musculus]